MKSDFFLSDEQLKECFLFFHEKPKDEGNLNEAYWPSDAHSYCLEIERTENGVHVIRLFEYFKSEGELCKQPTKKSLKIYPNKDFYVGYEGKKVIGWGQTVATQEYKTYNIVQFLNFLEQLTN